MCHVPGFLSEFVSEDTTGIKGAASTDSEEREASSGEETDTPRHILLAVADTRVQIEPLLSVVMVFQVYEGGISTNYIRFIVDHKPSTG